MHGLKANAILANTHLWQSNHQCCMHEAWRRRRKQCLEFLQRDKADKCGGEGQHSRRQEQVSRSFDLQKHAAGFIL